VGNLNIKLDNIWESYYLEEYTELRGTHLGNFNSDLQAVGTPTTFDKLTKQYYSVSLNASKEINIYVRKEVANMEKIPLLN